MSNPTSNYSFQMPTSTDLVTDLPADFEVFGQAVDTQMKTNADAAIAKTIVDAKGDLIAGTGSDTVSRLAIGTNDQVLTADSTAATGMKWATSASGGMTLLSTTTLSGSTTTVSSINQGYTNLYVVWQDTYANTGTTFNIRFNSDTGTNYRTQGVKGNGGTVSTDGGNDDGIWFYDGLGNSSAAGNTLQGFLNINNYTSTGTKPFEFSARAVKASTKYFYIAPGVYFGGSAITSMTFSADGQTFTAGTVRIYGVK